MDEYIFKRLPDNLDTFEFEGAIPARDFLVWSLNLDKDDPLASATTMYSSPLALIPGTNVTMFLPGGAGDKNLGTGGGIERVSEEDPQR